MLYNRQQSFTLAVTTKKEEFAFLNFIRAKYWPLL